MRAFSLVELSIVLVILGLLTGGILSGQSLIRAAELRSVATDYGTYTTAFYNFRDKYHSIPGDTREATKFWQSAGGAGGTDTACMDAQTQSSPVTCNGDGNGQINQSAIHAERFLAWKHMANAGLIEGSYLGRSASTTAYLGVGGENVPNARIGNATWEILYRVSGDTGQFTSLVADAHFIAINGKGAAYAVFTPEEAWNIDIKLDDGSPTRGRISTPIRSHTNSTNCATSDFPDAEYDVAVKQILCKLNMKM